MSPTPPHDDTPARPLDLPRFWRGLEELADPDAPPSREFPPGAETWSGDAASRREFLRLAGASLALAGASGCAYQVPEAIVPYVEQPAEITPGKPLFYATALVRGGYATGVLVESHTGRPTKVEGNPDHPASLGATDAIMQAAVLDLCDPDRSQVVVHRTPGDLRSSQISTWDRFEASLLSALDRQRPGRGAGLRILTEAVTSPTLADRIRRILEAFPEARWHQYEPTARDAARQGARLAFGDEAAVETHYQLDRAEIILSLEADFLADDPARLRYARQFAARRTPDLTRASMNRLYVAEGFPTITGAVADHRLAVPSSQVAALAQAVARGLGVEVPRGEADDGAGADVVHGRWIEAVVADLKAHPGACVVIPGNGQPPGVHALAHAMNHALGNVGKTVLYTEPVESQPVDQAASLRELVVDMQANRVELLLILGGNPVYCAPADVEFVRGLTRVAFRVHLSLHEDETSALCHWHLPQAHELEAWGDARAFDGTVTIQQPLIEPLYDGRSPIEVLATVLKESDRPGRELVKDHWREQGLPGGEDDFEAAWRRALHDGVVAGSALPTKDVPAPKVPAGAAPAPSGGAETLEVLFRPDPTVWDGRFANNGWLQELPKPLTKLCWDNAAFVSPKTAEERGLEDEDWVELTYRGRTTSAPIWVVPGHADGAITLTLGYGRTSAGRVGTNRGYDAYRLRTSDALHFGPGLELRKLGTKYPLATTQTHRKMEGRGLVRFASLAEYRQEPHFVHHQGGETPPQHESLYPDMRPDVRAAEYQWGMAINLGTCIGCNACVVACQAENNIPVVGKDQVRNSREMHWLEVDRYYEGDDAEDPTAYFQPRLCMHCEKAPCELVCPVEATTHSVEGLNEMTYNRCVGTRYCSNNCPYKVRHFNFLHFAKIDPGSPLEILNNPDVTVRFRGVMEKCTYCVQRINEARIESEIRGEPVRDADLQTACQQACPTRTIVFGNLNDRTSEVNHLKALPLNYGMLAELNTRPRTTYLAKVWNPNPALAAERPHDA